MTPTTDNAVQNLYRKVYRTGCDLPPAPLTVINFITPGVAIGNIS